MNTSNTNTFSRFGFILTAAGSAIGIGTIWRLPYLTVDNGGGTFLLIYLIATFIIGIFILLAELIIGKYLGNPFLSKIDKLKNSKVINKSLYIYLIISLVLGSFYFVVCGWSLFYFVNTVLGNISYSNSMTYDNYDAIFNNFISNPIQSIGYTIAFILLTLAISYAGIIEGVEKVSLIFIPLLCLIIIIILIKVLNTENISAGIHYLTSFNFKDINPKLLVAAFGQALFSLSVGQGIMITFSSFVKKDYSITGATIAVTFITLIVAVLAVFLIVPPVFFSEHSGSSGVGLAFKTLPLIFANLAHSVFYAILFFLLMTIAAITSIISLVEVLIAFAEKIFKCSRRQAIGVNLIVLIILTSIQALSFSLIDFKILGSNLFDFSNQFTNALYIFSIILIPLIIGWGIDKSSIYDLITNNQQHKFPLFNCWLFCIKFIVPFVVPLIIIISMFV